ncbi:MAG: HD domain-containing phosphohydrolase [Planctomycetota bacterium]
MKSLDIATLRSGTRLPQNLYSRQGVLLLRQGSELSEELVKTLAGAYGGDLFLARTPIELDGLEARDAGNGTYAPGRAVQRDTLTAGGIVVVEAGEAPDELQVDAIRLGGVAATRPASIADVSRDRRERIRLADAHVAVIKRRWDDLPLRIESAPASLDLTNRARVGWPDDHALRRYRASSVDRVRTLYARVLAGVEIELAEATELIEDLIERLVAHPDRFTRIALLESRDLDFLPDHAFTCCCLSICIGARLGWSRTDVALAGLSGLFADIGMGLVPERIRRSPGLLDEAERSRVERHSGAGVILLEVIQGMPESVRRAVYQHHERLNGSGYPDRLRARHISDLARAVSVADSFGASLAWRNHRAGRLPYHAIEEVVRLGSERVLDRKATRALVQCTGIFPVGSWVRLSTGLDALVVGNDSEALDRPMVRVKMHSEVGPPIDQVVRLSDHAPWELSVIKPIEPPLHARTVPSRRDAA